MDDDAPFDAKAAIKLLSALMGQAIGQIAGEHPDSLEAMDRLVSHFEMSSQSPSGQITLDAFRDGFQKMANALREHHSRRPGSPGG